MRKSGRGALKLMTIRAAQSAAVILSGKSAGTDARMADLTGTKKIHFGSMKGTFTRVQFV